MSRRLLACLSVLAVVGLGLGAVIATGQDSDEALFATANGANEIAQDGTRGAGDDDGFGSFTAVRDGRRLCYGIALSNTENVLAAHIHRGGRNTNGAIVVPGPNRTLRVVADGDPGASAGCVNVSSSLLREIFANPSRFYFNVHTDDFRDGAIRGQLSTD